MKNKYKFYLFLAFFYLNIFSNLNANEFNFQTSEINITDNGNIINASNGEATSVSGDIKITAEKFNYNKYKSILNASSKATATLIPQNIKIKAENIQYNENTSVFNAKGNVRLKDLTKNILIETQNIFFDTKSKIIKSNTKTIIKDNFGNSFLTETFSFNQINGLVKVTNAQLTDLEKNIYYLSKGFIDLSSNKFAGKDIAINFNNKSFNKDNEPRLKGNSILMDENETIIQKGVFTTCKKNDDCPPWQMTAKKITHNKSKKTIYYDDAWLKLYNKPVAYFPKFFHPDPTVKRQSGFLMPSLSNSTSLGSSLNIPYFKVLSDNKDFTLRPRLYSNKVLLQSEYRQVNKKSNHILDFSYMTDKNPTKNHFFSESTANVNFLNFDESEIKLKVQQVSNDTYLKTYKLESPLINNETTLSSSLEFETYREDLSFNTSFHVFETLGEPNNDRYEYIYPNYSLTKSFVEDFGLNGSFSLNSSGFIKNYNTNVFEKVVINDLLFDTNPKIISNGLRSNFNFLIKNINAQSSMSERYKEDESYRVVSLMQYNLSYPLLKKTKNYKNSFKPMMAVKLSPNNTKNIQDEDRRLDIANIYTLNRIGSEDNIEEGASLTYGFEYLKSNKADKDILGVSLANVLRVKESDTLPNQSSLGDKTSDIVGNLTYSPNNFLNLEYDFLLDNNLNDNNYQSISSEFKVNNFITSFEYLNENKTNNSLSYISNKTSYNLDESNNLLFEIRENKKTGLTEFYNLIYQYKNDCLKAAIEYNKDYYTDGDLKPQETVFFKLTIIPFGETSSTNLLK